MVPGNERYSSNQPLTKYCLACKAAFIDQVVTCKVVKSKDGEQKIVNCCPECGSDNMFYLKRHEAACPQA